MHALNVSNGTCTTVPASQLHGIHETRSKGLHWHLHMGNTNAPRGDLSVVPLLVSEGGCGDLLSCAVFLKQEFFSTIGKSHVLQHAGNVLLR